MSERELSSAFAGWSIDSIDAVRVETRFHDDGAPAWLATIRRA